MAGIARHGHHQGCQFFRQGMLVVIRIGVQDPGDAGDRRSGVGYGAAILPCYQHFDFRPQFRCRGDGIEGGGFQFPVVVFCDDEYAHVRLPLLRFSVYPPVH